MKLLNILKIVTSLFLILCVSSVMAKNPPKKQQIQGAFAFPTDEHQVKVRVSVTPNSLSENEKTLNDIMKKMTVVVCAEGECQFANTGTGLGFFESKFKFPKLKDEKSLELLVVACSYLGCDQKKIKAPIVYPDGKK